VSISKDAFETQVLAILGPLHAVARRLTKNEADAEDLVAESITRAWRARASLADTGAFRAWRFLHQRSAQDAGAAAGRAAGGRAGRGGERRHEGRKPQIA
jgi:DNA-directed RNA polymerase specialized sigma24 family protein